ncbi:MAG: succinylglutamate desuccinylase/aspartoacylase family protein [Thiothrix sp.]|nr:succinylglutamate desuccinylase/aspartoacylase family protein [Thiothrix sp.]HPQ94156.1 M14 family metallopeptidase [Thiolinea sp.]
MPELTLLDTVPEAFFTLSGPQELGRVLPGPTLIHQQGQRDDTLFVSTLLHGNEDSGFYALQQLLRDYQQHLLPRNLSLFFGNIEAAQTGMRRLSHQPDYNRIWPGHGLKDSPETRMAAQVMAELDARNLFASIDIHNNTGDNPFYSCISQHDTATLQLAALFAPITLMYGAVKGVQSIAMARHCPAMTIECGKPGVSDDVGRVVHFLKQLLELPDWTGSQPGRPLDIYRTVVRVNVPDQVSLSFSNPTADLLFPPGLERMNFRPQPAGTVFAHLRPGSKANLLAFDDAGNELGNRYFLHTPDKLVLSQAMIPAMLTHDETVIRQDCLCYLLERIPVSATAG